MASNKPTAVVLDQTHEMQHVETQDELIEA